MREKGVEGLFVPIPVLQSAIRILGEESVTMDWRNI